MLSQKQLKGILQGLGFITSGDIKNIKTYYKPEFVEYMVKFYSNNK
jgi:hypothetical protein